MKRKRLLFVDICFSHCFFLESRMLRNVPLAANPKRAMLITIKERWFHWLMENTLVRSTSKVRDEKDSKNTALRIMDYNLEGFLFLDHLPKSWSIDQDSRGQGFE
jgi:hypothetical protein